MKHTKQSIKTALILLAGGSGTRTQLPVKKQHIRIQQSPLWQVILRRFTSTLREQNADLAACIIAADEPRMMVKMQPDVKFVRAGSERAASIQNALIELVKSLAGAQAADELARIYAARASKTVTHGDTLAGTIAEGASALFPDSADYANADASAPSVARAAPALFPDSSTSAHIAEAGDLDTATAAVTGVGGVYVESTQGASAHGAAGASTLSVDGAGGASARDASALFPDSADCAPSASEHTASEHPDEIERFITKYRQALDIRVLISDIARCFCSRDLIAKMFASTQADCAYAATGCSDTARAGSSLLDRSQISLVQTPQNSSLLALLRANLLGYTDESSAIAAAGGSICAVAAPASNSKLTSADDMRALAKKVRVYSGILATGCGFDLHEFCCSELGSPTTADNHNERLILGGIDCGDMALKAHSDGDVLTHAIIDALLGAACLGDIGEMFSDQDQRWRKASSVMMLKAVIDRLASVGLRPAHISAQILAQKPKISPFKEQIEQNLARICGCSVNIAASTTEKLGPIGQAAAIAAIANASLRAYDWRKDALACRN